MQVNRVPIFHGGSQSDLDSNHFAVIADQHQINLVVAITSPKVTHRRLGGLCGDPDRQL